MSDVALLERLISRVGNRSKALHSELDRLKKQLPSPNVNVKEIVIEFWRLLFRSTWTDAISAADLNILEKLISHGLITASSTLDVEDADDRSVHEVVYLLSESLQLTERLAVRPEMELEAIKIFLSASTTAKCAIGWSDLRGVLEALLALVARSRNAVNRSAAKGAVNQIVHDRLSSPEPSECTCKPIDILFIPCPSNVLAGPAPALDCRAGCNAS